MEHREFFIPRLHTTPSLSEYYHDVWYEKKTRMARLREGKKIEDMFSGVDRIPACDGQTDGQTSCDSTVRSVHMRRAAKTDPITFPNNPNKSGPYQYFCTNNKLCG